MNTKLLFQIAAVAAAALLAGCVAAPGGSAPLDSTKYTVENTDKFVLLDQPPLVVVSCTGLQEHRLADGRLEVAANVRNRENRLVQVQVSCVFKDAQGFTTGDETPFQTVGLKANATEVLRFRATNTLAQKYTIRLRAVR